MTRIDVPDTETIYHIAILVHNGWKYNGSSGGWQHPKNKIYKIADRIWNTEAESDWPFDEAVSEALYGD